MPRSPLRIESEDRSKYLYVYVTTRKTTKEKMFEWLGELSLLSAESQKRRILLDRDIPNVVMNQALCDAFGQVFSARDGLRFAIVNRFPLSGKQMEAGLQRFGKLPSNVKFFDSFPAAEAWLVGERSG